MSQASDFKNFLEHHVNLNQSRLTLLGQRVTAVQNHLTDSDTFSGLVTELIPQGSYAHGTIIKPVNGKDFDADVLMPLDEVDGWDPADYINNLYDTFGTHATYKTLRKKGKRCVTIDYANDFHIDVVPYVTRTNSTYIANRETNQFEWTKPDDFNEWLVKQNRITNGNLAKVVRLLKYLRDHKGTYVVPSVTLTAALAHEVSEHTKVVNPTAYSGLANTLHTLTAALTQTLDVYPWSPPYISDPGTGQNLADRWEDHNYRTFRSRFAVHAQWIDDAINAATYADALVSWQKLFGDKFGAATSSEVALTAAKFVEPEAVNEKFLLRDYRIPTALNAAYSVTLQGTILARNGFRDGPLTKRGNKVTKGRTLKFRVTDCTVPAPYDVYWKVRNHDEEAATAGCLRGDMHLDDGSRFRTERTAYAGSHWVEVYVVKNGVCVAQDRQAVIVL